MAISHYDKAIEIARENEYLIEEALSNELAAKYYYLAGSMRTAKIYMSEASQLYKKWGAVAKTEYLKEKYPELLSGKSDEAVKENGKRNLKIKDRKYTFREARSDKHS